MTPPERTDDTVVGFAPSPGGPITFGMLYETFCSHVEKTERELADQKRLVWAYWHSKVKTHTNPENEAETVDYLDLPAPPGADVFWDWLGWDAEIQSPLITNDWQREAIDRVPGSPFYKEAK